MKNQNPDISGEYVINDDGKEYPLSRKSNLYAAKHHPIVSEKMSCVLNDNEIIISTKLRRAKIGDSCHIAKLPLKELNKVIDVSTHLNGIITSVNSDKVVVQLTTTGCTEVQLTVYRNDVILTNIEDTHKVAYFICKECGISI